MNFKVKKIGQYKVILDSNNDPIDVWDEEDMPSAYEDDDESWIDEQVEQIEILDGELE